MLSFKLLSIFVLSFTLGGCTAYPRLLSFPFDNNGRGLNSRAAELNPHISAQYITFVSDRNGSQDVYLFDAKNRRLIDLPNLNSFDEVAYSPSISEDGRYLVFMAIKDGQSGLFLYDRTTQQKRPLVTGLRKQIRNPVISGNGERIAFEIANNGQWDIVVTDIRGKPINPAINLLN